METKMKKISEYFNKYGSDKCLHHAYEVAYDSMFSVFQDHLPLDILEIGVQFGGSLMAWKDYFPNAKVTGIDIKDDRRWRRPDVEMLIMDVKNFKPDRQFDIILDDGSHNYPDWFWVAQNLSAHLKPHGMLIVEDITLEAASKGLKELALNQEFITSILDLRRLKDNGNDVLLVVQRV